jgi:hypothetical protein
VQLVRTLASDLDRRGGRDRQLDLAPHSFEPKLELVRVGRLELLDHFALRVAGGGSRREVDLRQVPLVEADEAVLLLREPAQQHEQEPRREGIERPGMARPCPGSLAEIADEGEGRRARRLVHENQPGGVKPSGRHGPPRTARG